MSATSEPESRAPEAVRDGVREGILAALGRDTELRGGRTALRLILAGVAGVMGAIGSILLVIHHPFDNHPHGHELVFSAIWSGLLVLYLSLVFLQIRTPHVPLAQAAAVGLMALGIAGLCSLLCPDPHVMDWWLRTQIGAELQRTSGVVGSVLCFGIATTFVFAALPAAMLLSRAPKHWSVYALAAGSVLMLLLPGVVLESVGMSAQILPSWIGGMILGAAAGVGSGIRIGSWLCPLAGSARVPSLRR